MIVQGMVNMVLEFRLGGMVQSESHDTTADAGVLDTPLENAQIKM